jgi:hypothetical protein
VTGGGDDNRSHRLLQLVQLQLTTKFARHEQGYVCIEVEELLDLISSVDHPSYHDYVHTVLGTNMLVTLAHSLTDLQPMPTI